MFAYFCGNGLAIVSTEISGNLTTDMNELPTVWHKPSGSLYHLIKGAGGRRTTPMCLSTVCIRRFAFGRRSLDVTSFSTARTTPSLTRRPIAVLYTSAFPRGSSVPSIVYGLVGIFDLEESTVLIRVSSDGYENILARRRCCQDHSLYQWTSGYVRETDI